MAIGGSGPNAHAAQKPGGKGAAGRHAFIGEVARGYLGVLWLARDPHAAPGEGARWVRHVAPLVAAGTRAAILEAARWGLPDGAEFIEGRTSIDLVLPATEGEVLRSLLLADGLKHVADPPILVGLAERILRKLHALHERAAADKSPHGFGGVHPDSIVIDTEGSVHLIEGPIGAAASSREPWRSDPQRLGYMAPEQTAARPVADARTDVFAVGVILWEALAKRRLFPGSEAKLVRERVQKGAITRLDATRASGTAGVATPIADVIARALEREPDARFRSAAEMADAIAALSPADSDGLGAWVKSLAAVAIQKRGQLVERASLPPGTRGSIAPPPPSAGGRKSVALGALAELARPGMVPPATAAAPPVPATAPSSAPAPEPTPRPGATSPAPPRVSGLPPRPASMPPRPSATVPPSTEPDMPPTEPIPPDSRVPSTEPTLSGPLTVPQTAGDEPLPTEAAPGVASAGQTPDTEPSGTEVMGRARGEDEPAAAPAPLRSAPEAGEIDVSDLPEEPDDTLMSAQPIPGAPPADMSLRPISRQPPTLPASVPPPAAHLESLPAPGSVASPSIGAPSQLALLTAPPEASLDRRKILLLVAAVGIVGVGAGFFLGHLGRDTETRAEAALPPVLITAPSNPAASTEPPAASAAPAPQTAPSASSSAALPGAAPGPSAEAAPAPAAPGDEPVPAASSAATAADPGPERARAADSLRTDRSDRPEKPPRRPSTDRGSAFKPGGI